MDTRRIVLRATAALYQRISAQLILLATFVAMAWFLVYFTLNSGYANRLVDGTVNPMFRGKIGWSRVTWGPMPWSLEVLEPVLVGASGQPIVTAGEIHIEAIELLDLLEGKIAARGVRIERPVVRLTSRRHPEAFDDLGQPRDLLDIVELFWPPGPRYEDGMPGDPPHLEFSDITITDGAFVLDMPSVGIVAEDIDISSGRFEIEPNEDDIVMHIGAESALFKRGEVRIRRGEGPASALASPTDEVLLFPVRDVEVSHFRWFGDQFSLQKVIADHRGDRLLINRYHMRLDTPDLPYVAARVHLLADDVADHLAQFGVRSIRGPALLTVDGRGEIDGFDGHISLEGERLAVGPARLGRWTIRGHKDIDDRFDLQLLEVNAAEGTITATGGADLEGGHAWADLWLDGVDPTALPVELSDAMRALVGGELDGPIAFLGRDLFTDARQLSAGADLRLRRRGAALYGLGRTVDVQAGARLVGDRLRIHKAALSSGDNTLEARGRLNLDTLDARLDGGLAVAALGPITRSFDVPVSGSIEVPRFTLRGRLTDPEVNARVVGRLLRYDSFPAVDLKGPVSYRKGTLRLEPIDARPRVAGDDNASIRLRGSIGVSRRGTPLDLTAVVRQVSLAPLDLGDDIGGRVGGTIRLTGPTDRLAIDAEVTIVRPRWRQFEFSRLEVDGRFARDKVEVERLVLLDRSRSRGPIKVGEGAPPARALLTAERLTLDANGYAGTVVLDRVPLALLGKLGESAPDGQAKPFPVAGAISAELGGAGTFEDPGGGGRITLHDIAYTGYPKFGGGALELRAVDRTLQLEGRLFDRFDVDAVVPTRPGGPAATARVRFIDLAVEEYLPQLDGQGLAARISGEVQATMDLFEGGFQGARARIDALAAGYAYENETYEITAPAGIELSLRDDVLGIERLALVVGRRPPEDPYAAPRPGELRLSATGSVNLGERPTLAVDARADFDLPVFEPFLTGVFTEIDGDGRLWISARGPVDDPRFEDGGAVIESASLVPRSAVVGAQIDLIDPLELQIGPFPNAGPVGVCSIPKRERPAGPEPPGTFLVTLARPGGQAQRVRLERDESPVTLTGVRLEFRRYVPDRMRFQANVVDQTINIPRTLRATVDVPDLAFEMCRHLPDNRAPETRMIVEGKVKVSRGEYTADVTSASEINQGLTDNLRGTSRARSVSVFERIPMLKQLYLNLSVWGDGDFYIRNQITVLTLDLEIRPDLKTIRGLLVELPDAEAGDQLELGGRVDIVPGSELIYARRPFEVSSGAVSFGGGNFLDAEVQASHTFRIRTDDGTVASTAFDTGGGDVRLEEVTLRGRYRLATRASEADIDLDLTSNSGASDLEIATLVLTGSLPDRLGGAAGAQPATEVLLGPLLGLIERPLEDTLDLDLSLTPATTGTLFIDADKLLSRRLRLYSRTLVGDEDGSIPQTFGLEYRINNAATAELSNQQAGTLNSTSGRLRLRFDLD